MDLIQFVRDVFKVLKGDFSGVKKYSVKQAYLFVFISLFIFLFLDYSTYGFDFVFQSVLLTQSIGFSLFSFVFIWFAGKISAIFSSKNILASSNKNTQKFIAFSFVLFIIIGLTYFVFESIFQLFPYFFDFSINNPFVLSSNEFFNALILLPYYLYVNFIYGMLDYLLKIWVLSEKIFFNFLFFGWWISLLFNSFKKSNNFNSKQTIYCLGLFYLMTSIILVGITILFFAIIL